MSTETLERELIGKLAGSVRGGDNGSEEGRLLQLITHTLNQGKIFDIE